MGTSASYLSIVQQILTRYGMSAYVTFGNIGNILAIGAFCQSNQRLNSCSLYLLLMTICNLICLDVGIIPIIYSLDHPDITTIYLLACRLQFYIRHTSFQMMRTYKVLACIDRFALSSSQYYIRAFSKPKIAILLIIITGLFWILLCIFFVIVRTIENGSCNIFNEVYSMIYTIYYMIFAGILPPLLILIFTILVMRNLKQLRSRVQPSSTITTTREIGERKKSIGILRKRDRDLIKMVYIEVMVYVLSTLPFSIYLVYKMLTNNLMKSLERQDIESFINYMTQSFLMYLNTALPFYIYILSSPSFRRQTIFFIIQIYSFILRKQIRNQNNENTQIATIQD